jgi:hypothetical protein
MTKSHTFNCISPVISLSKTLSTAIFEGAQQRILAPYTLQACFINLVVSPVP